MTAIVSGIELQTLKHKVIYDERAFSRDSEDRRYSVWATEQVKAIKILKDFGFEDDGFQLQKGQILAVFLNDDITENLIQIVYNKTTEQTFADYAASNVEFKLKAAGKGKKYSHVTAVVFTPTVMPSHLAMRGMIRGGLSEKQ